MKRVGQYDIFELVLKGEPEKSPSDNPFLNAPPAAVFSQGHRRIRVKGFYDGENQYLIRFMPDRQGEWSYQTENNPGVNESEKGSFQCVSPRKGEHGPVRVNGGFHFIHDDGTVHLSFGTTCYAWAHQSVPQQELTLKTLETAPFNKMRMCVFPKWYPYNRVEPELFPFLKKDDGNWDYDRFNPAFFHNLEIRIGQLRDLGIQADLILFHPYDEHWGFSKLPSEVDDRYLRYVAARFSAYSNVWWSMANEFDLMKEKTMTDWDRFFKIIQEEDPYGHLRSIHNCGEFYDHSRRWVTHASIQRTDLTQVRRWREEYRKPVVVDECCYEGNIKFNWGNLTGEEMVNQFWTGMCNGGYVGHGETYVHPEDLLWWSKGGVLHGKSPERIGFLKNLLEQDVRDGQMRCLNVDNKAFWNETCHVYDGDRYYLWYQMNRQSAERIVKLPEDKKYHIDLIDCWNMKVEPLKGEFSGENIIILPGKPMYCIRAVLIDEE